MTASAIVALRAHRRAVVVERRLQGASQDAIAAELGIGRHSVHHYIQSAISRGELPAEKPQMASAIKPKLLTDAAEGNWRKRAACRDVDPELFFPVGTSGPALLQVEQAKAVCARCPYDVRAECLSQALRTGEQFGVWGGLSESERRAVV